ncbi:hypothetical protein Fcan01_24566 [Folsomia candida]|uniref:Uncharacterized protein n=1 Tax=Folsomia candida TaxID=158441 RepID=A0A226D6M9_FOLCA|nr:hypothetical protein Fcan01_24566 [Folsomia candida]
MANLIAEIKNEELSFKANGEGGEEQQQFNIAFNAQNASRTTPPSGHWEGDRTSGSLGAGEWYPISIHNAHYIPGAVNLFSEGIMDQKGFKIVKENGKTTYYFKGQQGPQAWWLNGIM